MTVVGAEDAMPDTFCFFMCRVRAENPVTFLARDVNDRPIRPPLCWEPKRMASTRRSRVLHFSFVETHALSSRGKQMLVLKRKAGERIRIGQDVELVVLGIEKGRVKLGFSAPPEVPIHRDEVVQRVLHSTLARATA